MSIKLASVCPVCGRPKGAVSLSEYDCGHCGFQNAYLQSFAGAESLTQWQKAVQAAKGAWQAKQRAEHAGGHRLTVGNHAVALLVPQEHALYLASTNGQLRVEQNVVQFSASERNDAVVYADGTVKVQVSSENGISSVTVSDTGIGIAPEHQSRVFERFYRVDKSHSKASGGTGLGLSIVKHAVQYHHGDIHLTSKPGEGTTIRITFPAAAR